jgi:hypothetical protein
MKSIILFFIIIILSLFLFLFLKNSLLEFNYEIFNVFFFLFINLLINFLIFSICKQISLKTLIFNLLINNKLNQLLLFFFIITIINSIISFLLSSKFSINIYIQAPIILFYLILYTHSIYIFWFIWNEINNEMVKNFYLLFIFIFLVFLFQLFVIWNITYIEVIMPNNRYTKTYTMLAYCLISLMLLLIYLKKKLIIILKLLGPIFILIYYILENNLDIQLYNGIYIPFISSNIKYYYNIILIFSYILISLKISLDFYNKIYHEIYDLNDNKIKYFWLKNKNFNIFIFILFIVMLSLMILYYFLGDYYVIFNLYNLGLFIDLIAHIIINLIKAFFFILKYIWIIIKFILLLISIIYYDLIIYNWNLYYH